VFTVKQVSPACVGIGHFTVLARAGVNRVRFAGAVRGQRLAAGTYRISIRTSSGHVVRRVTLVVVDGRAPSRDELRALRLANTCAAGTSGATSSTTGPTSTLKTPGPPTVSPGKGAAEGLAPHGPGLHGILGSSVAKTAHAIQPFLVALLALAILLLAVASLPRTAVPEPRVHDLLALAAVALAFLLS
jgi:hypothetical protein